MYPIHREPAVMPVALTITQVPDGLAADLRRRATANRLLDELDIDYAEPAWPNLPALARRWALSAYAAAYLQLLLARSAPLVTRDARLAAAWDDAAAAQGNGA